jgi:formylglycine-generating enzyme required for sulfatase activity/tetratricopeptide (TPR) repeat protein
MMKRASDRYTTAKDMAEDLSLVLQSVVGIVSLSAPAVPIAGAGSNLESTPLPPISWQSGSGERPIKIVPKGLRSFDEHDADFFLELLPGSRDRDGLPESIRFWKRKIEQIPPDETFRVGLIYGPSGCGKSSLVKAGLLPRLAKHVRPVYIEATSEETETRLLNALRKVCPDLPAQARLVDSLAEIRYGRALPTGQKVLLVLDQFEQWLHATRGKANTELVAALRQCDGAHAQAVVMVRDDFWMAATSFFDDLETDLILRQNAAAVDLFDPRHAHKVLRALGTFYGKLPERTGDFSKDQHAFLDQAIADLVQGGKIISVRLSLFAEMLKGKPWTFDTLHEIGGTEGVGLTFLEETFSASTAPPEHRYHQKAAQAVLKALLPETGTDIKGQMRSRHELLDASGYANRPREFDALIRILDPELRLITPTDPEGSLAKGQETARSGRYYQLAHDYLVHSLREWLVRKQRETRRGRAELRLAERAALWNAKPENRLLPSAPEWLNIRLLTPKRDWTEPQRKMMNRGGLVHGLRALGLLLVLSGTVAGGLALRHRADEDRRVATAAGLVQRVLDADTAQVPDIVVAMREYRPWVDPPLKSEVEKASIAPRQKLHASLALLPVDATQVDYLSDRLSKAAPDELTVLRDALKTYRSTLIPKLWSMLETAKPGNASLLPCASALASFDPDCTKWEAVRDQVAQALVSGNPVFLGSWLDALRPVRGKLTLSLTSIFHDRSRPETEHTLATSVLADYASDDPDRLAELLMLSDSKAYLSLFPVAEKNAEQVLPIFRAELAKRATYSWNDPPPDTSWTKPDTSLVSRIESARGILAERFGFCQTMPLDDFLGAVEALRKSGYRPVQFRPYADQQVVRIAAVWTRDGRPWRISSGLTNDEVRQQDERNRKDKFLPVDVAGHVTVDGRGKPADRFAALWVEKSGDDDARMYAGMTAAEETEVQGKLKDEKLIPRTLHAMRGSDGQARYCGIWGRPPATTITGQTYRDQFQRDFEQNQANLGDQLLIDVVFGGASKPQSVRDKAQAALENADKKIKAKPDDLDARFTRAMAKLRLGENQEALDDLQVVMGKNPENISAKQYRVIALARLGKKQDALTELAKFQKEDTSESSKLHAAAVVAAELGEGAEKRLEALEAAIKNHPTDADLRYDAVRAFSLASRAISRSDKAKGRQLAERSLQWLREAVKNEDADFGKLDEDVDLDPIRDDPAFAEVMKAGHPDRRYAAVWSSDATNFEAIPIYGLDPVAHLQKCRELIALGHRPVSWSLARTTPGEPLVAASVWHRPTVPEELKDRLAARQARAAIALARMGKAEEIWSLLRHSTDPRLRSFLIDWLNPLGADPGTLTAELDRIDSNAKPTPAPGQPKMDAILFHPETSQRRALIVALETYGSEGLSPGERVPLIARLLDLYRKDPDAGIHGAAEWTLRKWGQREKLNEADAQLMKQKDWGGRRWFINGQGQSFAIIEGPVQFRMGSPPTEPKRHGTIETPRRVVIPRQFAIAAKEVNIEQWQRFERTHAQYGLPASFVKQFSPDPDGPMIGFTWYIAAEYCNWLSEQEGLPRDQWCYLPNESGAYGEGMSIPADVLGRRGYRLPTEAEWEYACRSGTVTSYYFGLSSELLEKYARYQANSNEHAWSCGSLLPNDLGLFDMLGNEFEWAQDSIRRALGARRGLFIDIITTTEFINAKNPRPLRGGSFYNPPAFVRAAIRGGNAPADRDSGYGFRPAKSYF